jgi:hypothetical protein
MESSGLRTGGAAIVAAKAKDEKAEKAGMIEIASPPFPPL